MKTKSSLLTLFLLLFFLYGNAQEKEVFFSKIHIGFDASAFEMQVKPYLLKTSVFGERSASSFDLTAVAGAYFKEHWYTEVGFSYANVRSNSITENILPTLLDEKSNTYFLSLDNSLLQLELKLRIAVDESQCLEPSWTNGDDLRLEFRTVNVIQSFGIPLTIGRVFGKNKLQYFMELNWQPSIYFRKKMLHLGRRRGLGLIAANPKSHCDGRNRTRHRRLSIEVAQEEVHYHLKDFRLDGKISAGIIHRYKNNYFKMGLFYGESISPFSKVQEQVYFAQMVGFKIGFRKIPSNKKGRLSKR